MCPNHNGYIPSLLPLGICGRKSMYESDNKSGSLTLLLPTDGPSAHLVDQPCYCVSAIELDFHVNDLDPL